jgi:hypothetical protein
MARRGIIRGAIAGTIRHRALWCVQFFGNALLAVLFAVWLLIPVANDWNIFLNAFVAIVIVVAGLTLHGGTLNYFRDYDRSDTATLKAAFWRALRHVVAIAICVGVFYLLWRLMNWVDGYSDSVPAYLRSTMPAWMRRYISLGFIHWAYVWKAFALRWLIIPGLLLPFVMATADLNFRGFWRAGCVAWGHCVTSMSYWFLLVIAVLVGVLAAPAIFGWTPNFETSTLRFESFSLVIRVIVAYELGLWAWMLACYAVTRASIAPDDSPDSH